MCLIHFLRPTRFMTVTPAAAQRELPRRFSGLSIRKLRSCCPLRGGKPFSISSASPKGMRTVRSLRPLPPRRIRTPRPVAPAVLDSYGKGLGYPAAGGVGKPRQQAHTQRHRFEETPTFVGAHQTDLRGARFRALDPIQG